MAAETTQFSQVPEGMQAPLVIMVGGFLGAGKTTTVGRLAKHYQALGKRVVVVTNDQAADLVDTHTLRSQGLEVGEVAGSCFCCNFNELTGVMEKLAVSGLPDVVLAEPVGSCTDLVATVLRPLECVSEADATGTLCGDFEAGAWHAHIGQPCEGGIFAAGCLYFSQAD